MSSDIFSRVININQFDLIYAGAQKNLGPAGTTLVIVKDNILGKTGRNIPTMLDYRTILTKRVCLILPCFSVYVSMLNLRWLKKMVELGGPKKEILKKQIIIPNN